MELKLCEVCNKPFTATNNRQKYCGKTCQLKIKYKQTTESNNRLKKQKLLQKKNCRICKKEFETNLTNKKYCCKKCASIAKKEYDTHKVDRSYAININNYLKHRQFIFTKFQNQRIQNGFYQIEAWEERLTEMDTMYLDEMIKYYTDKKTNFNTLIKHFWNKVNNQNKILKSKAEFLLNENPKTSKY